MTDYKQTLNLPHTDFPMKANLAQREPAILERWQQINLYQQLRQARQGAAQFILHDGPPYANGDIHVGHASNKILKDMVIKSQSLFGKDAPYVPGWDCHGLPIELQVEKKVGKAGTRVDEETFRAKCREYAAKQIEKQKQNFIRLGVLGQWDNPYRTMDYQYEADIIRCLATIVEHGHLHKGYKPVHWCCDCGSSLAEAEVEYQNKTSDSIIVRFPVADRQALFEAFGQQDTNQELSILIWTTTPWTLPASLAVSVGPEIDYALTLLPSNELIVVAQPLLEHIMSQARIDAYQVVAQAPGTALEHIKLHHPFYDDRLEPILLGEHVTTESGTGLVHTAPAHGEDDFKLCQQYGIEVFNPVNARGCFVEDLALVGGQYYAKANPIVIEHLAQSGHLFQASKLEHSYPHCWRHKTPLIFRATPQWFISMEQAGLRQEALQAIDTVSWTPESGQARITRMVAERPDWCISRQRTWGVPLPLLVHKESGTLYPDTVKIMHQVADLVAESGVDAWYEVKLTDLIGEAAKDYDKIHDILDVWLDAGVSHFAVCDRREQLSTPADLYLEGSDQHRGWFQSSLLTSVASKGQAPYRHVLTHGFVVDGEGHKMSKSLGNVVSPQQIVKTLSADILRLWVASTDYRFEMSLSDEVLKRVADSYRRIRNTARYLLSNLADFDPAQHRVNWDDMVALDQWAMQRAAQVQADIQSAFVQYRFSQVVEALELFCINDMGGFYLDVTKDRQYTCQANSVARHSTQTAMYHIVQGLVRWLAPILSFTADELWQFLPGEHTETSVFLSQWYVPLMTLPELQHLSMAQWQVIRQVRDGVNKAIEPLRVEKVIGSSLQADVTVYADTALTTLLETLQDELHFVFITGKTTLLPLSDAPAGTTEIENVAAKVAIQVSQGHKCARCWHYCDDIGQHADHPELCQRCVDNVSGEGEARRFA